MVVEMEAQGQGKGELSSVRSWIYVFAFSGASFLNWGIIMTFPVLFVAFLERFQKSRSETATIGSLQVGLLYMLTVIPGYFISHYGFRINILTGCFILCVGFLSSIFVTNLHYLYLTMGVITSLGASFLLISSDSAPLIVFNKRRTTVTIITTTVASIGIAVIPLTAKHLIDTYALSGALLLLAGIVLQGAVLGMLYPSYQRKAVQKPADLIETEIAVERTVKQKYIEIIKYPAFWCIVASQIRIDSVSNGCRTFLVDSAMSHGISESKAVLALSLWGVCSALCKLLAQLPWINRNSRTRLVTYVTTSFCWAAVTFILVAFKSNLGILFYCILAGSFHGINSILNYLVLADTMGVNLVVPAFSLLSFVGGSYMLISVPIAGMIYDKTQNYDVPYVMFGCIALVAAAFESLLLYFERRKRLKVDRDN